MCGDVAVGVGDSSGEQEAPVIGGGRSEASGIGDFGGQVPKGVRIDAYLVAEWIAGASEDASLLGRVWGLDVQLPANGIGIVAAVIAAGGT